MSNFLKNNNDINDFINSKSFISWNIVSFENVTHDCPKYVLRCFIYVSLRPEEIQMASIPREKHKLRLAPPRKQQRVKRTKEGLKILD